METTSPSVDHGRLSNSGYQPHKKLTCMKSAQPDKYIQIIKPWSSYSRTSTRREPCTLLQSVTTLPLLLCVIIVMITCFVGGTQGSVQVQQQLEQHQRALNDRSVNGYNNHISDDSYNNNNNNNGGQFPSISDDDDDAAQEEATAKKKANCARKRLQDCLALLQTLSTDHNLAFAATDEQLKKMCKTMRLGLRCVNDHVTLCFEEAHKRRIRQLLIGTQKTVQLLCNKGPLREKYLLHAPCMRNVSTDKSMCGLHYEALITSVDVKENASSQDTIRMQCCAFHTYLACVGVAADDRCGTAAGQFVEEYSYRTAGPIILTRCREYVPGSRMCTGAALGTPHLLSASYVVLATTIVLAAAFLY